MSRVPPLLLAGLAAVLGALVTLAIALAALDPTDVEHLLVPLAVAVALTVAVTAIATRTLGGASLRLRFVAIAAFATLIGLVNLGVLAALMAVSDKDATMLAILLAYALAAAVGAALAVARASTAAVERLSATARGMAEGDLEARAGSVGGGAELDALASTLDDMAARLGASLERERAIEAQRRDLIVAVSHDLRTPLADLRAMTEAIADRVVDDPDTIRRYSARIADSVDSLAAMVDDLFEFVQLDAGAIEAERERARVEQVVRSAVSACDAQASEKGLMVRTELGDAGDLACSPRLTRVVHNLLQNAIRHTPADGTVLVAARRDENGLELAVEDSGEGIDPAHAERVFEPFWRGDAARSGEGSGLGLALAKRIVDALGGRITVESEPARGSRFAVLLPRGP
ncbi:MAG: HAMP domain-containing sensor histidine kinase [Solirubrobacterales bacterium]